jgi:DNA invertase Pin-like site-specific DNA recombinase
MRKRVKNKKQKEFLKIFGDKDLYYSVRESCKKAKIGKSTFYRWLKKYPGFKKQVDKIKEIKKNDPFIQIKKGNPRACIKFLKKYGKSRGY